MKLFEELDTVADPKQNRRTMIPEKMTVEGKTGARPGQHVVKVSGPIRHGAHEPLQEALKAATGTVLIMDLTDVPFIDSSAIGVLVQAYVTCQKSGRKLALVGLTPRVKTVLHLSSVDILFTTFDGLTQAEAALG